MKKFGLFLLLFLVLLLAVDRGAARLLDHVHDGVRLGQRDGLLVTYLGLPQVPRLVVLGNSRTAVNVCPDSLGPHAFSLAHNGTTQVFQTGLLSILAQQHRLPETLLLHVDLDEYIHPTRPDDINLLKFYYGRAPLVTAYSREASWLEPLKHCLALYRHNGRLPGLAQNWLKQRRHPFPLNQGYEPSTPDPSDSLRTAYSLAKLNQEPGPLNRGQLRYLRDFVALCRQQHVRLICFTSPYYQRPRHVAATAALVDSLLRREHIPYLNYAAVPPDQPVAQLSAHIRYWRDATHLNMRGVPLYSQVLARQVRALRSQPEVVTHAGPGRP